ncbi:major facilitator superfamily domain-containing protein [Aspergillus crustosus]
MVHSASYPQQPPGTAWRSSKLFIVLAISIAMFTDYFLFSFIIPVLPEILKDRLRIAPSHTQLVTSIVLSMNALVSIAIAPAVGYISDRVKWKNNLMLSGYLVDIVGTAITAWSRTLAGLIMGRLIQTVAGSLLWIAGMAILGGSIPADQLARAMGICVLFVSAGLLSGPAISAALFNSVSYTTTWLLAFLVLLLGTGVQILMLEPYNLPSEVKQDGPVYSPVPSEDSEIDEEHAATETDSLLPNRPETPPAYTSASDRAQSEQPAGSHRIYWLMLRKKRVLTALLADSLLAILISSFEATIPLHIKDVFHWESLQAGILFLLLQAPTLILVFPAGWLKDRVGMRLPVTVGFFLMAPSLWVLGVPGSRGSGWASNRTGQVIYIVTFVVIGVCRTLMLGFGAVEVLRGATEIARERPGIFGGRTGHSRAFVLSNVTWKLGMFIGPLASGFLTESVGYYWMNVTLAINFVLLALSLITTTLVKLANMRFTLVSSILPLAATVAAIRVTEPKKNVEIDPSSSFTVKWDFVDTDATSFDLYLVNNAVYPPVDEKIASDIDTSDGSYTIDSVSGLSDGPGYQINLFSNEDRNTGILAQSQQFNVTVSDTSSSSTSSTSSTRTSSSSTSTESPSTTESSTTSSSSSTEAETTTTPSGSTTPSSSPTASASDASISDAPGDNGAVAVAMGAPLTAAVGLLGALLFNL